MRTTVARSPTWTRGGKRRGACITRVTGGGGERGGKENRVSVRRPSPFEAEEGDGWGSRVRCRMEGKIEEGSGVRRCGPAQHGRGGSRLL
jgi:hypothetical protein